MINAKSFRDMKVIMSATVIVAVGTVLAKTVGLGKELFVAYELGPGNQLDAFLFAYVFPVVLINVVGGALQAAFVPQYLETSARSSPAEAGKLAAETATLIAAFEFVLLLLLIPVIMWAVPMLAGGFDLATQALTRTLIPILMPLVVLSSISTCSAGLLNAHGKFAAASLIPSITPLMVVLALVVGLPLPGAYSLALGTLIGSLIEVFAISIFVRRLKVPIVRIPQSWRPEFSRMFRQFLPAAGSSLLMSGTLLIDQSFAAHLPVGTVSALAYGTRLTGVASTILVSVVSAIALPAFSRLVAERRFSELRHAFILGGLAIVLVSTPFAAICSFAADWIVRVMYLRGEFSEVDAATAASVQALHAWHIPVYALAILAVRGLAAVRATWLMLIGSMLNLVVDLTVNSLLVPAWGVAAIGFATTAMYISSAFFLVTAFLWRAKRLREFA